MRIVSVRRLATGLAITAGLLASVAPDPAAAATAVVKLKVSTKWAVVGFPVTATVTSTEPGTLYLSQIRNDGLRSTGPGYCGHPEPRIYHDIAQRSIPAGTTKITIQPARLWYFGGDLINPGGGCWNQATVFDRLLATVRDPETFADGEALVPFQRVL